MRERLVKENEIYGWEEERRSFFEQRSEIGRGSGEGEGRGRMICKD